MALIQCKYCEKNVSDKAKNCPHCGGLLIEDIPESEQMNETALLCEECNTEIPKDAAICPNCGCPVPEKVAEASAQKVEVTAVNLQMKKSTKKYIVLGVIAVALIAVVGSMISSNSKKNAAEEYINNVENVSYTMLTGAADAEDAGNLIKSVWYNSIYEEFDDETDKYTRPNGYFYDDFNDALGELFSDTVFISLLSDIEDNQDLVAGMMKDLKNPPEEHQEAYEALKEYYDAYLELTNLATDPTGSLQTFSEAFNAADTEVVNCLNAMELYIED